MSNQELITNAIAKMSNEEKATIFPPITRGYWSQSTDMPANTRHLSERVTTETEATKK